VLRSIAMLKPTSLRRVIGVVSSLAALVLFPRLRAAEPSSGITVLGTARVAEHREPDVVVWLEAPGAPREAQTRHVVLDQRNLSFSPHVLVVRVGTRVELPNNDRVFHNVFSFHNGKRFDLGLYPVGTTRTVTFDQPGLSRIFCNIHPNMAAYVVTVDSPYFAVSNSNGDFEIASVSPGTYRYHAWRARGPEIAASADLHGGQALHVAWP
jgi:plastocyanin